MKILPEKLSLKPATGCLLALYGVYLLFALMALMVNMDLHHHMDFTDPYSWLGLVIGFVMVPAYIYIFNRTYDHMKRLDFVCLCVPLSTWFFLGLTGAPWAGGFVPALILTGCYFLIIPLSRRFPKIARSTLGITLAAVEVIAVVLSVKYIPD